MATFKGLDQLKRNISDAQKALSALDGELGTVTFNPQDPASIEAAILQIEQTVDERVGSYAGNPIIRQIVEPMKERYRQAILDRAAAGRLERGQD